MTKEELIEKIKVEFEPHVLINTFLANEIIDMVLDYALSEIDENVVKVIENLKVKK